MYGHHIEKNVTIAINYFKKCVDLGSKGMCYFNYAYCLYKGLGIVQNVEKAIEMFNNFKNDKPLHWNLLGEFIQKNNISL